MLNFLKITGLLSHKRVSLVLRKDTLKEQGGVKGSGGCWLLSNDPEKINNVYMEKAKDRNNIKMLNVAKC